MSTATVSRVLNGSELVRPVTTERVRKAIAELNYVRNPSARSLRMGRTQLFGLIVSDIKNQFFPELIDAFEGIAAEQGIDVIFTHTNYDIKRLESCVRRMVERGVEGIAIMTSETLCRSPSPWCAILHSIWCTISPLSFPSWGAFPKC